MVRDLTGDRKPRSRLTQRLEFLEFRIYWEGRINRKDLVETFGISEPQAAIDFRKYQEFAPENLSYDRHAKCYRPSPSFKTLQYEPTADDYFRHLRRGDAGTKNARDRWASLGPPLEVVAPPVRVIEPHILRAIVTALRNREKLELRYISMNNPNPKWIAVELRALVFAANRWHARACRLDTGLYFDAVLSRILNVREASGDLIDTPEDMAWTTFVEVILVPNPNLGKRMQDVVKRDYSMTGGKRVFNVRKALLFYFINTLPGDIRKTPNKTNPKEQEVIVLNYAAVRKALLA